MSFFALDRIGLESEHPALSQALPLEAEGGDWSHEAALNMVDYPRFEFSKNTVTRAGKVIAGEMIWTDESEPEIRKSFQIANNWRDSHAFPMRSIRSSIASYMSSNGLKGITAARLKRMQAIRGKLRRISLGLDQIQDLGGCRVILDDIQSVQNLLSLIRNKTAHQIRREDDYISNPKIDGYRSHHIIFGFKGGNRNGVDTTMYDDRRIELQVRTKLQHSWATAVEAVGLYRDEALKNNQGDERWLRFFKLISMEFAEAEGFGNLEMSLSAESRRLEIRNLENDLNAISILDRVNQGIKGTDFRIDPKYNPSHFIIRYDRASNSVTVHPYDQILDATSSYDLAEKSDNQTGLDTQNVVLVEVGKIKDLKRAYPNYFGDVHLFLSNLRALAAGENAREYKRSHQPATPAANREIGDPTWLGRTRFPRPDNVPRRKKPRDP